MRLVRLVRLFPLLVAPLVVAVILADSPGTDRARISLDVLVAVTAGWTTLLLLRHVTLVAPPDPAPLRLPIRLDRPPRGPNPRAPLPQLAAVEGLLATASDHPRVFATRLRPRLRAVAEHRLRVAEGIDLATEPERAAAALGDLAWMLDPSRTDRAPTPAELDRLLRLLDGADRADAADDPDRPDRHGPTDRPERSDGTRDADVPDRPAPVPTTPEDRT